MENKKCGTCVHFKRLVDGQESWGECTWWEHHKELETMSFELPMWSVKLKQTSGVLSPNNHECSVWDGGE